MAETRTILQICPSDHPPFKDLCAAYERAAAYLRAELLTVFLSGPQGAPLPGAVYLEADDLRRAGPLARQLDAAARPLARPALAICHRYRSLRVLRASRVAAASTVTVAHDFGLLRRRQRRWYRALFARDVLFAGVSPAVQADLAQVVGGALCLPNALDLAAFDAALLPRQAALEALGLAGSDFTVGVVGRLIPWKRPALALDAWRRLAPGPGARMLFLGDGPLAQSLREVATGLNVHFAGFRADARRLLRALDVLLVVSTDREAFGMVALEAMAAGVPVVGGTAPGPAFVTGGEAFVFDAPSVATVAAALADARRAVGDGRAAVIAGRARLRVETEFSVAALARRLEHLLR